MRLPIFAAMLAGFCMVSGGAFAEMPNYDVEKHCSQVASFGGSTSQMIKQSCYQQEQGNYDSLKPAWDALPATMRAHCDQVARFGGAGSYMILKSCVDQERASAGSNQQFQFKR